MKVIQILLDRFGYGIKINIGYNLIVVWAQVKINL
jgi:hypothetical protein